MKVKKVVSNLVKEHLKEAFLWYNSKQTNLGKTFLKEVSMSVNYLCQNPLLFQIRYNTIRIAFLENFPYGVHYEYFSDKN